MDKYEQLKALREIFVENLCFTPKQFEVATKMHPELLEVDTTKFNETFLILHNGLKLKPIRIRRIAFSHPALLFMGKDIKTNLFNAYNLLHEKIDVIPKTFQFIVSHNPRILTRQPEKTLRWIDMLKKELDLSDEFIRHLMGHAHDCQPIERKTKDTVAQMKYAIEFLEVLGFKKEDYLFHSPIIMLKIGTLNKRYKLNAVNGFTREQFLNDNYKFPEEIVYARAMAINNGFAICYDTPYVKPQIADNYNDSSDAEILQLFPYNNQAKNKIDDIFAEIDPDTNQKIKDFYFSKFGVDKSKPRQSDPDDFESMFLS